MSTKRVLVLTGTLASLQLTLSCVHFNEEHVTDSSLDQHSHSLRLFSSSTGCRASDRWHKFVYVPMSKHDIVIWGNKG